ncbi:hypothetical protein JAK51_11765 [Stenotrophomonas maltophilia]|uniref:hypothetical protein n=1 Tax=Stenotrophomonas maltophilia TaxID=40324 RepID=UPI0032002ABA|nr:hypothetical protein [Stenotrophomonas maltophilia]
MAFRNPILGGLHRAPLARAGRLLCRSVEHITVADGDRAAGASDSSRSVSYHSIIARQQMEGPLEETSDGVVPYWSSHLQGAASELVLAGEHSIQESPRAITEIRRILKERPDIP